MVRSWTKRAALQELLTVEPACPSVTCAKAKMKKKPAKRRKNQTKKASRKATKYNEPKSADLLDLGEEDVHGNRYLFTTKND